MHPAISVILFTVLSGAGFGVITVVGSGFPFQHSVLVAWLACGLALAMSIVGLVSSTFHLGHPERAWRALTQWRSSWLSREGIMSLVTLALFSAYSAAWIVFGERLVLLGWLCSSSALATVFTTAMIYAQLKTVPQWHTPLTPACYVLFSLASGALIVASMSSVAQIGEAPVGILCFSALFCAWATKWAWWRRAARTSLAAAGSTPETATGLGAIGKVRLLERPHTGPNYLTQEMVHRIGRKHADKLRRISLVFGAVLPMALCGLVQVLSHRMIWESIASLSLLAGLLVERWLFFAEAEHSVSLYY